MKLYDINRGISVIGVLRDNEPTAPYGQNATRLKILAVDDDPQVCRLMTRILDAERFAVICAAGVDEAIRLSEQIFPDAVLLDLHLSAKTGQDGITCLRTLQRNGYGKSVYIISGDGAMERARLAAKFGADGYLVRGNAHAFWTRLEALLASIGNLEKKAKYTHLAPAAALYWESRGLSDWDLELLNVYMNGIFREKEIARITGRNRDAERKSFQLIRDKLGANSPSDLGRMSGVLSWSTESLP